MTRFSLEEWLKDKSRKVVTRDGREVEIFYYNADKTLLVGRISPTEIHQYTKDGFQYEMMCQAKNDLFFADEEEKEELDEFEKELQAIISEASHWTSDDGSISTYCQFGDKEIKKISRQILDLARKEILKSLPKWKKMPSGIQGNNKLEPTYLIRTDYGFYFTSSCLSGSENNMYIELVELENLPKE